MNCYYGKLEGFRQNTVLLSLELDRINKVKASTPDFNKMTIKVANALRPFDEKDRYLQLERKHLPCGVGFSGYSRNHLLYTHNEIMKELVPHIEQEHTFI